MVALSWHVEGGGHGRRIASSWCDGATQTSCRGRHCNNNTLIGHCLSVCLCDCVSVCVLSSISCLQECNQWAVHLYMVWGYALVVPHSIIFFLWRPWNFLEGVLKSGFIVPIECHAANVFVRSHACCLLLHLCPASLTPDSLTLSPVYCFIAFARHCWPLGLFIYFGSGSDHIKMGGSL